MSKTLIKQQAKTGPHQMAKPAKTLPKDRLRARLLQRGAQTLSDAELLAVVLGAGLSESAALDSAHQLLEKYGGLQQVLGADNPSVFCEVKGLGEAKYALFKADQTLIMRSLRKDLTQGSLLNRTDDISCFLKAAFGNTDDEVLAAFFLDTKNRLIVFEHLLASTYKDISLSPRRLFEQTLSHNAAAIIFAHHRPIPQMESEFLELQELTQRLNYALDVINVQLVDYFIVNGSDCVSLKDKGII